MIPKASHRHQRFAAGDQGGGLELKDLKTTQSSLEEIFVNLVKAEP